MCGGWPTLKSPASVKTELGQYGAVRLFESAVKRRHVSFELSGEIIPEVIRICSLVEGMPLGIVLAASWAQTLSPKEIAAEITRNLTFLDVKLQDLPRRQRGMRSVFNHSWRLLNDRKKKILRALSVFRGGFTREAAQQVTGASLGDLMGLTHQTWLHRTPAGRFEIHEMLRQFAAEQLKIAPAVYTVTRDRHSDFFCQILANCENDLEGERQGVIQAEMGVEIDNIRTAWAWAVEKAKLDKLLGAINALCHIFSGQYRRVEAEEICRSLVEKLDIIQNCASTGLHSLDETKPFAST